MKTRLLVIILMGIIISGIFGTLFYLDQPKTPADCRKKHGKVKEAIEDCVEGLQVIEPEVLNIFHNNHHYNQNKMQSTEELINNHIRAHTV